VTCSRYYALCSGKRGPQGWRPGAFPSKAHPETAAVPRRNRRLNTICVVWAGGGRPIHLT
jgi:hypothetical protein